MTKQYFTYDTIRMTRETVHMNPTMQDNWKNIYVVSETSYSGSAVGDGRMLGWAELSDNTTSQGAQTRFWDSLYNRFTGKQITAQEAADLCNSWYPVSEEHAEDFPNGYFSVVDGEIVDGTPEMAI